MSVVSVCYFSCSDCKTALPVPERVLESEGYFFNCSFCGRPISLRNIHKTGELEIIEAFGCEYGGKEADPDPKKRLASASRGKGVMEVDSWISDSVSQANLELANLQGSALESSVVEGSASKWEIQKADGKTLRFDFFSEVRKAVLEGKIIPGDYISPFEGARHLIEDYPGTADLFGNQYSKEAIGLREIPEWKPLSKGPRRSYEALFYAAAAMALGGAIYFGYPHVLDYLKTKQGERIVHDLIETPSSVAFPSIPELKSETRRILVQPEILTITSLSEKLSAAVGKNGSDLDLIGLYSQVLSEMGALKGSTDLISKAEKISLYLKLVQPEGEPYLLSQARFLWRSGSVQKAVDLLSGLGPLNEDASYMLGKMHMDAGDMQKAIIYISDASRKNPNHLSYVVTLAEIYEIQGKFLEAAAFIKKALEIAPEQPSLSTKLLELYSRAQNFQALEDYYRENISKGLNTASNLFGLATLLYDQKKYAEAFAESGRFLAMFPKDSRTSHVERIHRASEDILKPQPIVTQPTDEPRPRVRRNPRRAR